MSPPKRKKKKRQYKNRYRKGNDLINKDSELLLSSRMPVNTLLKVGDIAFTVNNGVEDIPFIVTPSDPGTVNVMPSIPLASRSMISRKWMESGETYSTMYLKDVECAIANIIPSVSNTHLPSAEEIRSMQSHGYDPCGNRIWLDGFGGVFGRKPTMSEKGNIGFSRTTSMVGIKPIIRVK